MRFEHKENVFHNKYWRKLIAKLNQRFTPLVIMFEQTEALEDEKLLIVLRTIQNLRDNGIICIAAGSSELLSATINSKQTRLKAEFVIDAYAGVNYGDMLLAITFNINVFFHKHYINIEDIEDINEPDQNAITKPMSDEVLTQKLPEKIEKTSFLDNKQLKNTIATILDPFTQYLHLSQEGIMGLIESLRLYATLLDTSKESDLNALLVFIIASKYDRTWLKVTCSSILTGDNLLNEADNQDAEAKPTSHFMLDQNESISTLFKTTLAKAKDIIDACYGLSGQLKVSPQLENKN